LDGWSARSRQQSYANHAASETMAS
jgi:hypothetical protein